MTLPKTNVVITCWNALDYTKATIQSLFTATHGDYYLTIVDNNSQEDTAQYLRSLRPPENCKEIRIITNSTNMGPGHAANQGFAVSKELGATFTCLCNNDLYFQTDWLTKLEEAATQSEDLALVGPLRPATSVAYDDHQSTTEKLRSLEDYHSWREELQMYTGKSVISRITRRGRKFLSTSLSPHRQSS